jgi:hypothetical protein
MAHSSHLACAPASVRQGFGSFGRIWWIPRISSAAGDFLATVTFGRGMPQLILDAEGIEMRNVVGFYRRWQEVEQFRSFLF